MNDVYAQQEFNGVIVIGVLMLLASAWLYVIGDKR